MENERGYGGFSALCSFLRGPIRPGRSLRLSLSLLQVAVLHISRSLSPIESSRNGTFFPSGTFSRRPSNINSHFCVKSLNLLYMPPGISQSMVGGV